MNKTTSDIQTALSHLKEAVFEVLSPTVGMSRKCIIKKIGLCLPKKKPGKPERNPEEVITGILFVLYAEGHVKCCDRNKWYRRS